MDATKTESKTDVKRLDEFFTADPTTFTVVPELNPEPEVVPLTDDELEALILEGALGLLSDPGRWTQGTFAQTKEGRSVSPESEIAWRFCAAGSVRHIAWGIEQHAQDSARNRRRFARLFGRSSDLATGILQKMERLAMAKWSQGVVTVNDADVLMGNNPRENVLSILRGALDNVRRPK